MTTPKNPFAKASIKPGSTLLLHSSITRTLQQNRMKPEDVISAILEKLGREGTLLLPLFNFDFNEGVPFDYRSTPSHMGALTEIGRKWPGAVRTGHPVYSFAVIGRNASEFEGMDNKSAYGPDSPFAKLRELEGEIGVIDLPDQQSMTIYHHVEEMLEVPYRFHKDFTGTYVDREGMTTERTYSIYVRDLDAGVKTSVDRMGERLWAKGLYRGDRPKEDSGLRIISANDLFDEVEAVIRAGEAEQYLFELDKCA
ncbi:AAC(3) family N-acetyltransferase [Erythrobacter ani]|uniref:Aminoglycoside N(3)-acetyltransferase n=1 Tax=Erythrobacter ani TaxID=2827235 RepID=A0ABS6SJ08_9SPHN|nr:AAC(3) family N-acetyltransferase [Erythrobacter ani]MBV7264995.1 AAC(3) family N-acetyltransferase [Erythrobacter ani]